ncbi:MAG: hypothetical protein K0R80_1597 [Clostridia bacterium]|jgi:hypothetical protein|nr:hypothetical protein [Clostridia bacterium]
MDEIEMLIKNIEDINESLEHVWRNKAIKDVIIEVMKNIAVVGPFFSVYQSYTNRLEFENLTNAVKLVNKNIEQLDRKQKIDMQLITGIEKETYFLYKLFLTSVLNNYDEKSIEYLSVYAANCINKDFNENEHKLSMLNKIIKYSSAHFKVLKFAYDDSIEHGWPNEEKDNDIKQQKEKIGDMPELSFDYCINELLKDGFVIQHISMFSHTKFAPYEITNSGEMCLKMINLI